MVLSRMGRIGCRKAGYETGNLDRPPMEHAMQALIRTALLVLAFVPSGTESILAQAYPPPASNPPSQGEQYSSNEVIDAGHRFFGTVSRGLAEIVERAGSQWGLPNGYVLGEEASGAWVAGLRYGNGILYTMPATVGSTGKGPRSVSILVATARVL
jgi:hypothetical protein